MSCGSCHGAPQSWLLSHSSIVESLCSNNNRNLSLQYYCQTTLCFWWSRTTSLNLTQDSQFWATQSCHIETSLLFTCGHNLLLEIDNTMPYILGRRPLRLSTEIKGRCDKYSSCNIVQTNHFHNFGVYLEAWHKVEPLVRIMVGEGHLMNC